MEEKQMSGLYNMLMGKHPFFGPIAKSLGFCVMEPDGLPPKPPEGEDISEWLEIVKKDYHYYPAARIRDVWITEDGEVGVLTRNYGELEWVNELWRSHPEYKKDWAESDETYHSFLFSPPEKVRENLKKTIAIVGCVPAFEAYTKLIKDFANGKENEATKRAKEVGAKIMDGFMKSMDGGGSNIIENEDGGVEIITLNKDG